MQRKVSKAIEQGSFAGVILHSGQKYYTKMMPRNSMKL